MHSIKVTLFQKAIGEPITRDQRTKLIAQRSDFLILPRLYATAQQSPEKLALDEKKYLDKVIEISEYYKGVIVGGTIFRHIGKKLVESCPIVQDLSLVDYYNLRSESIISGTKIETSDSETIFILSGIRFAIIAGNEYKDEIIINKLKDEKINIVFCMDSPLNNGDSDPVEYESDLKEFSELAKNFVPNVTRTTGVGISLEGKKLSGRCLYAAPDGLKWKVALSENSLEIIKTVNISLPGF
jgi:hypothetical protein